MILLKSIEHDYVSFSLTSNGELSQVSRHESLNTRDATVLRFLHMSPTNNQCFQQFKVSSIPC